MPRLDPIFAIVPRSAEYLDSPEFLSVRIASLEDDIECHEQAARAARTEIPILERQAAEHERDAAEAKLKLIDLQAEAARRQASRR